MARVTIITAEGTTRRMPAAIAAWHIESNGCTLDERDERGVAAMATFLTVRRVPLRVPKPPKPVQKPAAKPAKKAAGKKASTKAAGGKKQSTKGKG